MRKPPANYDSWCEYALDTCTEPEIRVALNYIQEELDTMECAMADLSMTRDDAVNVANDLRKELDGQAAIEAGKSYWVLFLNTTEVACSLVEVLWKRGRAVNLRKLPAGTAETYRIEDLDFVCEA